MRRYLSVLALAARSTIYRVFGLLLLTFAAEAALFYRALQSAATGGLDTPEALIDGSGIPLVCGASFLLLCALLSLTGYERAGCKTRYTIRRLSVREETVVLLWACYNTACFILFWAVQVLAALVLCRWYLAAVDPAYWNGQTVFLAFYRSGFLHSLLPLAEKTRFVRNGALAAALGLASACFAMKQRRGKLGTAVAVLAVVTLVKFPREMGSFSSDITLILVALSVAAWCLCDLFRRDWDEA